MIALTQERRIALIEHAEEIKDRLSEYGYPFQPHKTKQLLEIALASLTAEPIAHADSKAILKMIKRHTRFFTSFPERSEAKRVGLFIAPPVPEIKLPSEKPSYGSGISEYDSGYNDGCYDTIEEIKRLNGLGE